MSERKPETRKQAACVVCGAPVVQRYRPFCSSRCADIDLNRWLKGAYAVPAVEEPDPEPVPTPPRPETEQ